MKSGMSFLKNLVALFLFQEMVTSYSGKDLVLLTSQIKCTILLTRSSKRHRFQVRHGTVEGSRLHEVVQSGLWTKGLLKTTGRFKTIFLRLVTNKRQETALC